GGPIRKDRLFFFFNYEGAKVSRLSRVTGNTATPALLAQLKPELRRALELYLPASFTATSNPLIGLHQRNDQQKNAENTYLSRVDALLGKHRLSTRYSYNNQDYSVPTLAASMPRFFPVRFHNAVIQDSTSVNASSFNELRIGFNRVDLNRSETGREQVPAWVVVNGGGFNASQPSYIHFITTTYTLADNFSVIRGAHTFKMGFELREVRSARIQGGQPTYTYNNPADLITDQPNRIQVLFGGGKGLRTRNTGYYFQDDWRLSRHLQVNLGMRYEYSPPLRGGFNVAGSDPYGPFIKTQEPMFAADRNDFAPRAGLVWDPAGNQRTVIRAGAAIGYLMPQAIHYYDMAFIDPSLPFVTNFAPTDVPAQFSPFPIPQAFIDQVAGNPSLLPSSLILSRSIADYNRRDTYAGQWNLTVQQALNSSMAVQAAYVGSRTVKLISTRTLNLVDPRTGRRPDTRFGDINFEENAANLSHHALELTITQKARRGLSYEGYFTWGRTIGYYAPDSTQSFAENTTQDPLNLAGSKGVKAGNIGRRFAGIVSYALPGAGSSNAVARTLLCGWTLQSILSWRSGIPMNVISNIDTAGNGRPGGQRPDPVNGVDPYIRNRDGLIWLNPAAFDLNGPRTQRRFGNLGYNSLIGLSAFNLDAALHKSFAITERQKVTFRFEMFNATNHTRLNNPNTNVSDPNFGRILGTGTPRNIQLALKYSF
ncbi:MAG: TonB-dependent receptor, partial [Bryobacteraceae bacterium]